MDQLLEKGRISASQLMFSVCYFMQGSILAVGFYAGITEHESWVVIISGALVSLPFIGIYIYLINQFPGKNLMQINEVIFGKFIGKIFSAMYIFYFLSLSAFNMRDVSNFVGGVLLPETPITAILIPFIFICGWAAYKGVEVIVRYSMIFVYLWTFLVLFTFILLLTEFHLENFLPIFSLPLLDYVQAIHISSIVSFNELIVFMVIVPYVRERRLIKKSIFSGILLGSVLLLLLIVRDIPVLGKYSAIASMPTYESLKLIHVTEIFTRMEIIFAIFRLIVMFFKNSFLYYIIVLCIAQVCNLKTYKPLVFVVGSIIISYTILVFNSTIEHLNFVQQTAPFFCNIFQIVLPVITLIIFQIKKGIKPQKETNKTANENQQDNNE